ncbi:cholecystokinin receptor type A-like [Mytilus trossulus]|uniref:cholecystokinin receptor type A-like n=1 Tax=Mytilus trossulus TaxID=6551 RepID=UPI003005F64B
MTTNKIIFTTTKSVLTSLDDVFGKTTMQKSTTDNIGSTIKSDNTTARQENSTNMILALNLDEENINRLLKIENTFEAEALTPITVYLILLMITGVVGNTIVLYIYKFRFKRSTSRIFILSLAAFDLITCILGMPYHILDMLYPYLFVWDTLCKVLSFALTFTILASIFILDLIAIDRYRKICRPFKKQLSGIGSKIMSWVTVLIAIISAIPMLLIYGTAEVPTARNPNITGRECYVSDDYIESYFPLIYDSFTFLIFIVSVFILVGFYSKVGVTIWKRRKFNESSHESKRSGSSQSTPNTSIIQLNVITDEAKRGSPMLVHYGKNKEGGNVQIFDSNSLVTAPKDSPLPYRSTTSDPKKERKNRRVMRLMSEPSSTEHDSSIMDHGSSRSHKSSHRHHVTKKEKRTLRITGMLFVITIIFIISFLPYLCIQIVNGLNDEFWDEMSISEIILFNLLMRTYFINSMINPIIYWFLDHKFKEEVIRLFNDMRNCKATTRFGRKSFHS